MDTLWSSIASQSTNCGVAASPKSPLAGTSTMLNPRRRIVAIDSPVARATARFSCDGVIIRILSVEKSSEEQCAPKITYCIEERARSEIVGATHDVERRPLRGSESGQFARPLRSYPDRPGSVARARLARRPALRRAD